MYLNPIKQKEYYDWLDAEWEKYQEGPLFEQDSEQNIANFLYLVKAAFASSTAEAYIDAWYQRFQQKKR